MVALAVATDCADADVASATMEATKADRKNEGILCGLLGELGFGDGVRSLRCTDD